MPDETNLTEVIEGAEESSGLDDLDFEGSEESGEGDAQGTEEFADEASLEQTSSEGGEAADKRYTVKYNGQELKLTENELITHAQKGMNYDHVKNELDTLRRSPELRRMVEQGRNSPPADDRDLARLLRENPGNDKVVREVQELRLRERERVRQDEARAAEQAKMNQWLELFREKPDFRDIGNLPDEVKDAISRGEGVLAAWRSWENRDLRNKLKMIEQNAQNRDKAPGSVRGDARSRLEDDPFLQGFFES